MCRCAVGSDVDCFNSIRSQVYEIYLKGILDSIYDTSENSCHTISYWSLISVFSYVNSFPVKFKMTQEVYTHTIK
jgi:hypothetical protein